MRLSGSITALATPFTVAGEIDFDAWHRLLRQQLEGGSEALVVAGSTGEAAALYDVEFEALLRSAVELVAGKVPVVAGTGQSNTAKTVEQTRRAAALGADAALVVVPPYVRPTQSGMEAHFRAVADDGALPVLLYNVPSRTGSDLQPATAATLAAHPRIIGIKEARNDEARMAELLRLRNDGFVVLSGDDPTAARAMLAGADGLVSVASNAIPRAMRRLCELARGKREAGALALDARLQPIFDFLAVEPNPIPLKALLARMGFGQGLRLPLQPLPQAHAGEADHVATAIPSIEQDCRDPFAA